MGNWRKVFQRITGLSFTISGFYLSTLTTTVTEFVPPGIDSIVKGFEIGAFTGKIASIFIGTVGVATGGTAIPLGAFGMSIIGGLFGAIGVAGGGGDFQTTSYPLIEPWFWVPLVIFGIYLMIDSFKQNSNS